MRSSGLISTIPHFVFCVFFLFQFILDTDSCMILCSLYHVLISICKTFYPCFIHSVIYFIIPCTLANLHYMNYNLILLIVVNLYMTRVLQLCVALPFVELYCSNSNKVQCALVLKDALCLLSFFKKIFFVLACMFACPFLRWVLHSGRFF